MENTKRDYSKYFTDKKFWDKVLKFGKSAGVKVTYTALILYYTIQKPLVPAKAKAVVYGALGYFIFPLDLIPDVIPVAGYADDIGMLLGALAIIAMYIDTDSKQQARNKIVEWFGESVIDEVASIDEEIEKKKSEDSKS
ncbi:YkvA family protein [Sporosarcina aquimarina]|uniref:DUF1232 domain-containing protein n=1 Tax=Sporosarcina aquimarina TaxID=114975 RepID=A0ABU4G2C9_9BACL|nr:DUF1232 domain-containing protein [Sporosarcina aquimarina]MDW0110468.1 DUF1232 domain-containing protein [Sporosarcina aquimarina]